MRGDLSHLDVTEAQSAGVDILHSSRTAVFYAHDTVSTTSTACRHRFFRRGRPGEPPVLPSVLYFGMPESKALRRSRTVSAGSPAALVGLSGMSSSMPLSFVSVSFSLVVSLLHFYSFHCVSFFFQVHRYHRALSVFEGMRAAGVTPDNESFSAATEACACAALGNNNHDDVVNHNNKNTKGDDGGCATMGDRAMELMRLARGQGLRRPTAKAVAATLAALVGGGPWRKAIPAVEAMLAASGRRAWDDVMEFLVEAEAGRERGIRVGEQVLDGDGFVDGVGAGGDVGGGDSRGAVAAVGAAGGETLPFAAVPGNKAAEVEREGSSFLAVVAGVGEGAVPNSRKDVEKSRLNGSKGSARVNGHDFGGENTRATSVAVESSTSSPPPLSPGNDSESEGGGHSLVTPCSRREPRTFAGVVETRRISERREDAASSRGESEGTRDRPSEEAREGRRSSGDEEAGRKSRQQQQQRRLRPRAGKTAGTAVATTSARKRGGASSALAATTAVDRAP